MELSCGEGSFICLHLDLKSWLYIQSVFYFSSLSIFAFKFTTNISSRCLGPNNHLERIRGTFLTQLIGLQTCDTIIVSISILIYALRCDRMVISCGWMGIFCSQMGLSHHNLSTFALYFMLLLYPTLQSDGCIMCSDGYMMRSDGYSLRSDAGPHHIFNFTFFLFLNSCQQHPFDSLRRPSCPTGPCDGSC